jgi:hypothetical protein
MTEDPYRAPRPAAKGELQLGDQPLVFSSTPQERNAGPKGLGGWLILVGINVCMSPLVVLGNVTPLLSREGWALMLDAENALRTTLWCGVSGAILLAAVATIAAALYFRRSRRFPRWYIAFLIGNLLYTVGIVVLVSMNQDVDPAMTPVNMRDITNKLIHCAIWVPYLLTSRRVRNTFIEPKRGPDAALGSAS